MPAPFVVGPRSITCPLITPRFMSPYNLTSKGKKKKGMIRTPRIGTDLNASDKRGAVLAPFQNTYIVTLPRTTKG